MVLIITALRRIGRGILSGLFEGSFAVGLFFWDISLTLVNTFTFKRRVGRVTPKGQPGEGGTWPDYIPPQSGDSRCSCPALNAMANHGSYHYQRKLLTLPPELTCVCGGCRYVQGSSHATGATSPSARFRHTSALPTTFRPPSASSCRATSHTS